MMRNKVFTIPNFQTVVFSSGSSKSLVVSEPIKKLLLSTEDKSALLEWNVAINKAIARCMAGRKFAFTDSEKAHFSDAVFLLKIIGGQNSLAKLEFDESHASSFVLIISGENFYAATQINLDTGRLAAYVSYPFNSHGKTSYHKFWNLGEGTLANLAEALLNFDPKTHSKERVVGVEGSMPLPSSYQ